MSRLRGGTFFSPGRRSDFDCGAWSAFWPGPDPWYLLFDPSLMVGAPHLLQVEPSLFQTLPRLALIAMGSFRSGCRPIGFVSSRRIRAPVPPQHRHAESTAIATPRRRCARGARSVRLGCAGRCAHADSPSFSTSSVQIRTWTDPSGSDSVPWRRPIGFVSRRERSRMGSFRPGEDGADPREYDTLDGPASFYGLPKRFGRSTIAVRGGVHDLVSRISRKVLLAVTRNGMGRVESDLGAVPNAQ